MADIISRRKTVVTGPAATAGGGNGFTKNVTTGLAETTVGTETFVILPGNSQGQAVGNVIPAGGLLADLLALDGPAGVRAYATDYGWFVRYRGLGVTPIVEQPAREVFVIDILTAPGTQIDATTFSIPVPAGVTLLALTTSAGPYPPGRAILSLDWASGGFANTRIKVLFQSLISSNAVGQMGDLSVLTFSADGSCTLDMATLTGSGRLFSLEFTSGYNAMPVFDGTPGVVRDNGVELVISDAVGAGWPV